jgi:acyl-CoA thioester hydrolase
MARESVTEVRVRYGETDQMGVVYHANYIVWCELGRTEYIRQCGMSYAEMERTGTKLAVTDITLRLHASARYDEIVRITTRLAALRSRAVEFSYEITRPADGVRIATAGTTLTPLSVDGRVTTLPAAVKALLERDPLVG